MDSSEVDYNNEVLILYLDTTALFEARSSLSYAQNLANQMSF